MRPRFFEQNDQDQLKEDLLTEIKKNGMILSVEQAMEKMQAQEEEYHRQRYMQQSLAQQQHQFHHMQYQQQIMYPATGMYEHNF